MKCIALSMFGQMFSKYYIFYINFIININEMFSTTFDGMIRRYVLTPIHRSILKYKVIMLGDSNVGKSCLIERFCGHPFPNWMDSTIGVPFNSVTLKVNHSPIVLEFWDISGQVFK